MASNSWVWALRHALAILVLPFTVTVVIPAWLALTRPSPLAMPATALEWLISLLGVALLLTGIPLFAICVGRFARAGRGTLAPWDPPERLVTSGPYAYVRNPMISGVILLLLAEACLLRSGLHLGWAGIFFLANATYIPLFEEPRLRARFGDVYDAYARAVPRLVPRRSAWRGPDPG